MGTLYALTVVAGTRSEADEKLNASIQELQPLARQCPARGILVTKHGPGRFTVELSQQVPYGETWESVGLAALDA